MNPVTAWLSMMLSTQVKRVEIADEYHARGKLVIAGGISTMHMPDMVNHVDSVFLGESEGRMEQVMDDWVNGIEKDISSGQSASD